REDPAGHRGEGHRAPTPLLGQPEGFAKGLYELALLVAFAVARPDGVDHALEGKLSRGSDHRRARRERPARSDQPVGFGLQLGSGGARDDPGDAAAVRKMPIGGVDDSLDRLLEEIAPHHLEQAPGRYFFLREDLRFLPFLLGTLAPARRACDRPMAIACLRLLTFFPERPLRSLPRFRSCIAFFTFCRDFLPYLAIRPPIGPWPWRAAISPARRSCAG